MKTLAAMLVGIPIVIYLVACVLFYNGQRGMMYFPTPAVEGAVAEELRLPANGEDLKIWYRLRPTSKAMLYFGGNAEDVARSIANLRTVFPDHSLYLMNYRGYGGSTGEPSEQAFYADAVALYDLVQQTHATISVIGRSLGSAVAAELAAVRPVERLALVTPFDSIENIVRQRFGYLPVSLLLKDKYELIRRVPAIDAPVFLILAENDEVVPRERSLALIEAFADGNVEAVILSGTDHNSIGNSPDYLGSLRDFFSPWPQE
jgi:pimeloyl-ACP methyl ester carboxylesterase